MFQNNPERHRNSQCHNAQHFTKSLHKLVGGRDEGPPLSAAARARVMSHATPRAPPPLAAALASLLFKLLRDTPIHYLQSRLSLRRTTHSPKTNMQIAIFLTVAVAAAVVRAAPTPAPEVKSVDVLRAVNKTLCPYVVDIDEDPDRVPRRIKVIKCVGAAAAKPVQTHHHKHKCEDMKWHARRGQCVELHDTVLVYYRSADNTTTYDVPVGCSCMFPDHATAGSLENSLPPA
ncbi:hypothetical protein JYU34_021559 [Plutella xylostella]|uniref:Uncharacterized protein n=1 Tax=Plutella xylostella TaxID=51655 RepID=A0ABQ7PTV5_PLUXY|nr:hypothetical protein JYU34_021559 [Plutella xylostella]